MGTKMAVWTGLFFWIEDAWDDVRGKRDAGNTVLASATVAGAFSLWSEYESSPQVSWRKRSSCQVGANELCCSKLW